MKRLATTSMILGASALLTACDPPAGNAVLANDAASPENATDPMTNTAEVDEAKSILRPVEDEVTPPAPPPVEPVSLTISFADGGSKLSDEAKAALDGVIAAPAMVTGGAITLRGHSDSRGYDGDNLVASRRRAEAVADYLVEKGVPRERMTVIALGENRPVAPNAKPDGSDDPEGRARNRRVEVEVVPPPEPDSGSEADEAAPAANSAEPKPQ
ncbi:OmpA family protein [Sphingomonas sp. ST-64]|uniref:OmpA family protein n=1 Tax=Sphingomonas plantiphila TaxID=3163295 RepID=A0ABW8YRU4_9SPHN